MSTKLPVVKDLIEIVVHASTDDLEQYEDGSREVHRYTRKTRRKAETHVKLKKRHVKITRRPKGFFRHLNNFCYASHPVL